MEEEEKEMEKNGGGGNKKTNSLCFHAISICDHMGLEQ